jgi:hypothetical protein
MLIIVGHKNPQSSHIRINNSYQEERKFITGHKVSYEQQDLRHICLELVSTL